MSTHSILIVDHEEGLLGLAKKALSADGYNVWTSTSTIEGIDLASRIRPELLVINPTMPKLSGVEAALRISQATNCKVLFVTEMARDADFREMLRGLKEQGFESLAARVPLEKDELVALVRRVIGPVVILTDQDQDRTSVPLNTNQSSSAPAHPRIPIAEYQLLLDMAGPQLYERNAFRVTGLATDASLREISRKAERLEMIAKGFGVAETTATPFSKTPPTAEDIKTALLCLKTPEQRLLHEFFWFWPTTEQGVNDPGLAAISAGEVAKARTFWSESGVQQRELTAVSARLDSKCTDAERNALQLRKKELERAAAISIHNLAVLEHIRAIGSTTNNAAPDNNADDVTAWQSSMRFWKKLCDQHLFWEVLVERIRRINDPRLGADIAEMIWASLPLALLLINAEFAVSAAESRNFEKAGSHRRLMKESGFGHTDLREALYRKLKPLQAELDRLCRTAQENTDRTPERGLEIVRCLFEDKKKYLQTFNYLLGTGDVLRDSAQDLVAQSARGCLVAYVNKTEDWEVPQPLFEECLTLASSQSLRSRLEDDLEMLTGNAVAQKAARRAQATAAPTAQHPPTGRASTTSNSSAKSPWKTIGAIVFLGIIVLIATIEHNSSSSETRSPQSLPSTSSDSLPAQSPASPSYSVAQSNDNTEINSLKATIDRNRTRLSQMDNNLSDLNDRMATLKSQIESDEATLDEMKRNHDLGYEIDIPAYENLRQGHNSTVQTYNSLVNEHNASLIEYRSLLSTTNSEVDRYNALVRSQ